MFPILYWLDKAMFIKNTLNLPVVYRDLFFSDDCLTFQKRSAVV